MRKYTYNLKVSVSVVLVTTFVLPFVFFYWFAKEQNNLMMMYDGRDAFVACLLLAPLLLSIGFCRTIAQFCAKDPEHTDVTMAATRNAGIIVCFALAVSGAFLII